MVLLFQRKQIGTEVHDWVTDPPHRVQIRDEALPRNAPVKLVPSDVIVQQPDVLIKGHLVDSGDRTATAGDTLKFVDREGLGDATAQATLDLTKLEERLRSAVIVTSTLARSASADDPVSVYVEQPGDLGKVASHAERRLADRIGGDHDRDVTARLRQLVDTTAA